MTTGMDLEGIMLRERQILDDLPYMWNPQKIKPNTEKGIRFVITRGGGGIWRKVVKRYKLRVTDK